MGYLKNGHWTQRSVATTNESGAFEREESTFRDTISDDHPRFKPEKNRYHLYVSYACPWAHRTLIYRALKGLTETIDVSVVHPEMLEHGWTFGQSFKGTTGDKCEGTSFLYEIYQISKPEVTCKVTVPVLWDKKNRQIVNNESSEIIRIFNSGFNKLTGNTLDLYPFHLRSEIDRYNELVYQDVNNGVYRTGFAKTQKAYDEAVSSLFEKLDLLEVELASKDFLTGPEPLECDWRLFTTLVRFDLVYHYHFKCNVRKIAEYPNLSRYLSRLVNWPMVKDTVHFDHIKRHYYFSHEEINPFRIVPSGPRINID